MIPRNVRTSTIGNFTRPSTTKHSLLGGSGVVISGVMCPLILIGIVTLLISLLITRP